jgi:hypothetical protein
MQALDSARPTQCPSGFWFVISHSAAARTVDRKAVSKLPGSRAAGSDVGPSNVIGTNSLGSPNGRPSGQHLKDLPRRIGNFSDQANSRDHWPQRQDTAGTAILAVKSGVFTEMINSRAAMQP